MLKKNKKVILWILSFVILLVIGFLYYTSDYYRATKNIEEYRIRYDSLNIQEEEGYIKIYSKENEDSSKGIIFYQGGKVEHLAYIPILSELAKKGYSCYLVEMPFHLAVFHINAAESIIEEETNIKEWYIGGHSLGGAMASSYAAKHSDKLKGIFLLGAYPASDLSDTLLKMLVLYGENDKVLNKESLEKTRVNAPKDSNYYMIKGGNHAGFGDYGEQKKDGLASISNEVQIKETVEYLETYLFN